MGYSYSRIDVLRHNCAYICGGIHLTPHWEPPSNRARASEPIGARDPPDPRHGKAPALARGRPPGLGLRGLSIPEEPNKPSYRQRAGGVADRSGYSAPRRRPTIARSVDGRDASTAQDVQMWQDSLHSELRYKRLSKGRFRWWPERRSPGEVARSLAAHQLQVLLAAGAPTATRAAPAWRPVSATS